MPTTMPRGALAARFYPAKRAIYARSSTTRCKTGWTIQALKAYAFSVWRNSDCDYVTEAAWRLSVEFADSNGCSGGRDFLKRFNADPERYSCPQRHVAEWRATPRWRRRTLMVADRSRASVSPQFRESQRITTATATFPSHTARRQRTKERRQFAPAQSHSPSRHNANV